MTEITVAIPVYNGEAYLERCLQSLKCQTESNFQALIFDNASTDATQAIAQYFCNNDSRFRYFRQMANKGAADNFLDSLAAANTEFFFWLAHDDFIEQNYIEELLGLFHRYPDINLAVPSIHAIREDGSTYGDYPLPDMEAGGEITRIGRLLKEAHPSWFYAIWRTEILRDSFSRVWTHYPYNWASDHLTLFTQIIQCRVAGSAHTRFIQTVRQRPGRFRPPVVEMIGLRAKFKSFCLSEMAKQEFAAVDRVRLRYLIDRYASHRCYGYRKILRRYLRERFLFIIGHRNGERAS